MRELPVVAGGVDRVSDERLGQLLAAVETVRSFVRFRLGSRLDEVEPVLQRVRVTVWRRAGEYDPEQGSMSAFVFGIARNVVQHALARPARAVVELSEDVEGPESLDPLAVLTIRFDAQRWMALVARFAGPRDWEVAVDLAFSGGDAQAVATGHQLSVRAVRTIRDRVRMTAYTVRAALDAADAGQRPTRPVLLGCVPEFGGLRQVAQLFDLEPAALAESLHLHPGSIRARVAMARRLMRIAYAVLREEGELS